MEKPESTLRIVGKKDGIIEISGKWDGKPQTYFIDVSSPGARGAINLLDAKGKGAGNLGPHRSRDGEHECIHYAKLRKMIYG